MGWWAGEPVCQGDQGADIVSDALDALDVVWLKAWGRCINKEEIDALVSFCRQEKEPHFDVFRQSSN